MEKIKLMTFDHAWKVWVFISAFFNSIVVVSYPWALISFYKSYLEDREREKIRSMLNFKE